ncbi:MAG: peptidylprolyl isomerase [Bacillota bacterium]
MKALSINGIDIGVQELVSRVKSMGKSTIVRPLVLQKVVEECAAELNITASVDDLQAGADSFRRNNELYSVAETERWLAENSKTLDDLEKEVELRVLSDKIRQSFKTEEVEKFFAQNKVEMDAAEISMLTVKDREVAMELLLQIHEEGTEFMLLARQYSVDEKAKSGGYVGLVRRGRLAPEIAAAVFGGQPGITVGPFEVDQGYALVQVQDLFPAKLSAQNETEIRRTLFERLLAEREQKVQVEWAI